MALAPEGRDRRGEFLVSYLPEEWLMRGSLDTFSIPKGNGIISGDDGRQYRFLASSWRVEEHPVQGLRVEFDLSLEGEALNICLDTLEPKSSPLNRYIDAVTLPFKQRGWLVRIGWVSLLQFIPVLGWLLCRGWRLDITRRVGQPNSQPLPNFEDIGKFIGDGLVLWIMSFIYSIPILVTSAYDIAEDIFAIVSWVLQSMSTDSEVPTLTSLLAELGFNFLFKSGFAAIYLVGSWSVYRVAAARYALQGKKRVFFDVVGNIRLASRHLELLMLTYLYYLITQFLLAIAIPILAITIVGSPLIPAIVTPFWYWTTGYLYGRIARRINLQNS